MQRKVLYFIILAFLGIVGAVSCEHEIEFVYPSAEAKVVFDGQISNESTFVRISHTRLMADSTKNHFIGDAQVWVASDDGSEERLYYDEKQQCYLSATGLVGSAGHTYQMRAIVDGCNYEAKATMPPPAPVDTIFFRWVDVLHHAKIFFVCVKGKDPLPGKRNYYLIRLLRGEELFRWNPRSGRSNANGKFEYDIICSTDSEMSTSIDDNGKTPLMDGDTLRMELMTIDRECWYYYQSMAVSDRTTTNPITNIRGGALGVFMAANITRPDTIVFNKETLLNQKDDDGTAE